MLQELSIKNFAIIDDLHIRFSEGLTILTGETGAGKSIIINAVNLLLGSRANSGFIRTGAEAAELEALFEIMPGSRVAQIMEEQGYDRSEGLLIRRIVARNEKHRIYINGAMASMKTLNLLTENLASISGQHAHQGLLNEDQHLLILDQFGGLMPIRENVKAAHQEILPLLQRLDALNDSRRRQTERMEILLYQKQEIEDADIRIGEDTEIERELLLLKNSETLYQAVYSGIEELYSAQNAIVERLVEVKKRLEKACQIDPELCSKAESIADTKFQIEDIVDGLRTYLDNIRIDAKRLEHIDDRLDLLKKLRRKYGGSLESVLAHLESVNNDLSGIENLSDAMSVTENSLKQKHTELVRLALDLSEKRKKTADILGHKVETELESLRMGKASFRILLDKTPVREGASPYLSSNGVSINDTGIDRATFLISTNVGEEVKPLANIASGGELSRVVLALRAILVKTESVETVVFDEVDSGIGGGVAEVVGQKLLGLSKYHQVICITHLAQIAKFGDHHYKISKNVCGGRTRTNIEPLNQTERVNEIARMLGGITMTQTTLDHALEMLKR
ncbi:MAG: DNA repair protein RecN [Desulfobacteraceae bacterium IS3]|nr:MAG: DNA repair protein RecN [Desulfobacteraceae bacterium IS3]HAO22712.1 DNA repair protein RecN [Desulfobacteraceae bacterium]